MIRRLLALFLSVVLAIPVAQAITFQPVPVAGKVMVGDGCDCQSDGSACNQSAGNCVDMQGCLASLGAPMVSPLATTLIVPQIAVVDLLGSRGPSLSEGPPVDLLRPPQSIS